MPKVLTEQAQALRYLKKGIRSARYKIHCYSKQHSNNGMTQSMKFCYAPNKGIVIDITREIALVLEYGYNSNTYDLLTEGTGGNPFDEIKRGLQRILFKDTLEITIHKL